MLDLNQLSKEALSIARARKQNDSDVLKHLAGEVIEAQEVKDINPSEYYALELADIIICTLSAAAQKDIDIECAINHKMLVNKNRILNET